MYKTNCPKCDGKMESEGTSTTYVGYCSPPGHNHDDNCRKRLYVCSECGEKMVISKRNRCPKCDWVGIKDCLCHSGEKVDDWPAPYKK